MTDPEGVVLALRPAGEAAESAPHAHRVHALAAAGQDLVRIGLVADIPHETVFRRAVHGVQRGREFDRAQPGGEVAARRRDGLDVERAHLVVEALQRLDVHLVQIRGRTQTVEQRIAGGLSHGHAR